jgi:hypothetical protein
MARLPTSDDFTRFQNDAGDADQKRREENRATVRRVTQDAIGLGEPLLEFITALPAVVMASQRAELERLSAIDKQHPRAAQVADVIDQLTSAAPTASRVLARAARGLNVARSPLPGLYGFVTDVYGAPLPGVVVRLRGGRTEARGKTEGDGYFMIPLARDTGTGTHGTNSEGADEVRVRIESASGDVLHEDPVPVDTVIGFDYREYIVEATALRTPSTGGRGGRTHLIRQKHLTRSSKNRRPDRQANGSTDGHLRSAHGASRNPFVECLIGQCRLTLRNGKTFDAVGSQRRGNGGAAETLLRLSPTGSC